MTLTPVPVASFGGLDLSSDAGEAGWSKAIDLLNVDVDQRGRVRSRDGYAKFTSAAAAGAYHSLSPFYTSGGTKQLIAAFGGASGAVNALNTAGGVVAAQAHVNSTYASVARFAAPGSEHAYVAVSAGGAATVYRWNGAAWSTPGWTGTTPTGQHLAVSGEGRLVNARYNGTAAGDNPSTVRFCDVAAGSVVPTTWPANNYVDLSPGDGEEIRGMVAWRDLLFVFKETKFFVFYNTSPDSSGNPVFNYRTVVANVGLFAPRAVCAAPDGVYFMSYRGIFRTTGAEPEYASRSLEPLFLGTTSPFWQGGAFDLSYRVHALAAFGGRIYLGWNTGTGIDPTVNDRTAVLDPATQAWTVWDIDAGAFASFGKFSTNIEELYFAQARGTKDVSRMVVGSTTDNGTAITSRYRSGFSDLGSPDMKRIHSWRLQGSGSPMLKVSTDFGALETGAVVTLGTAPAVAEGVRRYAPTAREVSWQIGATSAWSLNNLIALVSGKRKSGEHRAGT